MRYPVIETLTAAAMAATLTACGGPSDAQANAPDDMETPADAAVDETANVFDDIDLNGDSELDADEFLDGSEGPVFAFYMQREVVQDADTPEQIGSLDDVVLIDALYDAWDIARTTTSWPESMPTRTEWSTTRR